MSSIKNIKTNVLGYPRIGKKRELKKACEAYWAGKINRNELENTARNLRRENWNLLQKAGIDLIPSNDFSSNSLAPRITHNNSIIIAPDGDCKKKEPFLPYLTFL